MFYKTLNKKFDLLSSVQKLKEVGQTGEWKVKIQTEQKAYVVGRICAIRKSEIATNKAIKKLRKLETKHQQKLKAETL